MWSSSHSYVSPQQKHTADHHRSLIVGGRQVVEEDDASSWPSYAAAFAWTGIDGDGWGCGGALIHSDVVLTAAHCEWAFRGTGGAWIGTHNIKGSSNVTDDDAQFWPVSQLVLHPNYTNQQVVYNDVLLVKLNGTVDDVKHFYHYNTDPSVPENGDNVRVVGFGSTKENGTTFSDTLRQVDVQYVAGTSNKNDACTTTWPKYDANMQLCAGTAKGGKDACDSDSGSPLFVVNNDDGRVIQVGIVGEGVGCGRAGVPALYTRVSSYADWIHDTICTISDDPPKHCHGHTSGSGTTAATTTTTTTSNTQEQPPHRHHVWWWPFGRGGTTSTTASIAAVSGSSEHTTAATFHTPPFVSVIAAMFVVMFVMNVVYNNGRSYLRRSRRRRLGYQTISNDEQGAIVTQLTV